jgi:protein-disulfide isomerase
MSQLTIPVPGRDHTIGSPDAGVSLLEYGDYECPFCGQAHPIVAALLRMLGDDVLFAYRHFPITTSHPHSQHAAEAAEAAGAQGAFWPMHDTLFANQQALDDMHLVRYAVDLGLDEERFAAELLSHAHAPRVREDFMSGVRGGVNGTPSFFINGVRYDGPRELDSMVRAVQIARRSSQSQNA